jgi:hypothetical protein
MKACAALNGPLSNFMKERDLYVTKKTCYNLDDWVDRKKEELEKVRKLKQQNTDGEEEEPLDLPMELNPFVHKCALEAMHFAYGQVACPENPC